MPEIPVGKNIYGRNDAIAQANRKRFQAAGVVAINILSSPGSGKTSLLERTSETLAGSIPIFAIDGDVETENDANRLRAAGLEAVQIQTHGACHLDARMIDDSLKGVDVDALKILFIENIGNLVCPSGFDLGETVRVVVASTTEGDDKPVKYPEAFHGAQVCVLNKMDLLPYVDFDVEVFEAGARRSNEDLKFIHTSCRTGEGVDVWCEWLKGLIG